MRLNPFPKGLSWQICLNNEGKPAGGLKGPELAAALQSKLLSLKGQYYDPETGRVNYQDIRKSPEWSEVLSLTSALKTFNPRSFTSGDEKKAFWINLYNAIVINAIVELGIRESVWEVPMIFSRIGYDVGGRVFTADHIEHGILRCNAKPPYPLSRPYFGAGSPELDLAVWPFDPRIHFALVCGAKGCPAIRFYDAAKLDQQLDVAARTFVNSETTVDKNRKSVTTSSIFKFYTADFGGLPEGLSAYLAKYLDDTVEAEWLRSHGESVIFEFTKYDWALNKK